MTTAVVVESDTKKAAPTRRRALDGVRAVAAVGVLLYHSQGRLYFPSRSSAIGALIGNLGNFGVAVFFLLSGFLLFREFVNWILFDASRVPLPHYFERRFLRIYPAYWLALIGFVAVEGAANVHGDALGMFTLLGRSFDDHNLFIGLGVAWTLMIEVLFYITLPIFSALVFVVARRFPDPRARLRITLCSLVLLVVVAHLWVGFVALGPGGGPRFELNLPTFAGWFALGMALAVAVAWRDSGRGLPEWLTGLARRTWACWSLAAIAYVSLGIQISAADQFGRNGGETPTQIQFRIAMQGIAAFFLLLPVALGGDRTGAAKLLGGRVIAKIGLISYGIYLWHPTVIHLLNDHLDLRASWLGYAELVTMVLIISTAIAWMSHRFVERPAMRLAR